MKNIYTLAIFLFVYLLDIKSAYAQDTQLTFDTIRLKQTSFNPAAFAFDDSLVNTISIQTSRAEQMNNVRYKLGGEALRGMVTLATGIGIGSSKDVDWYLASTLRTNNPQNDWIYDVYCPGYIEKERTRVKNSNGSYSVETNNVNWFSWEKGALGYIIEKGDTVGWHYTYRDPRTDTAFLSYRQVVYKGSQEYPAFNYNEFALLGEFTGLPCAMLYNSEEDRIYLFTSGELTAEFQCVKQPMKFFLKLKKKTVLPQPYVLIKPALNGWDRVDALRLLMTGIRIKNAIEGFQ